MATPTFVQAASINHPTGSASSYTVTLSNAVNAGDVLVLCYSINSGTLAGSNPVSDNINGNWTIVGSDEVQNGTTHNGVFIFENSGAAGAGDLTITVNMNGNQNLVAVISEYSECATSSTVDGASTVGYANYTQEASSGESGTSPSITPVTNGDLIVVWGASSSSNTITYSAGALSTGPTMNLRAQAARIFIEDAILSTAGIVDGTATSGSSISWGLGIIALKPLPTAATPTFSPAAGTYTSTQTVTITSSTSGGTIYYTTDGTTPTTGSASISNGGTVSISTSCTLKAMEVVSGYANSAVGSAAYVINSGGGIGTTLTNDAATPATVANSSGFSWPITSPTTSGKVGQPTPVVFCDPNGNEYTVTGSTKGGQIGAPTPVCLCNTLGQPITPTIQLTSNGNSISITSTLTGVNRGRPIPVILTDFNGFAYVLTAFSTFGSYMANPTPIVLTDSNGNILTLLIAA